MTTASSLRYETARRSRLSALLKELARVQGLHIHDLVAAVESTAPPGWPLDIRGYVACPTFDLLADALEDGEVPSPHCTCPPPSAVKPGPPCGDGYTTGFVALTEPDCPAHGARAASSGRSTMRRWAQGREPGD